MYNSSNRIETPRAKIARAWGAIMSTFEKLDARSWAILIMAFVVLTGAAAINAWAMSAFFPAWLAILLSGYAEAGALGWKIADERASNSDAQKQLTIWSVWGNIVIFGVILVANLIRSAFHVPDGTYTLGWWDYTVFVLLGVVSVWHVAGVVLFREWDAALKNRRLLRQQESQARFDRQWQDTVVAGLRANLEARAELARVLAAIREEFSGKVSPEELAQLFKDATAKVELRFGVDLDNDGEVGSGGRAGNPTSGRTTPPQNPSPS